MSFLGKSAIFAGGLLFGTAGVKLLTSRGAKKFYAHTTAAVIRAKECIMTGVTNFREGCSDILADAHEINENIAAENDCCEIIEDESENGNNDSGDTDGI